MDTFKEKEAFDEATADWKNLSDQLIVLCGGLLSAFALFSAEPNSASMLLKIGLVFFTLSLVFGITGKIFKITHNILLIWISVANPDSTIRRDLNTFVNHQLDYIGRMDMILCNISMDGVTGPGIEEKIKEVKKDHNQIKNRLSDLVKIQKLFEDQRPKTKWELAKFRFINKFHSKWSIVLYQLQYIAQVLLFLIGIMCLSWSIVSTNLNVSNF